MGIKLIVAVGEIPYFYFECLVYIVAKHKGISINSMIWRIEPRLPNIA